MSGLDCGPENPNSELTEEWGTYDEGRRIEVERGPWSLREAAGLPSMHGPERTGFYLVQRDRESPHPMTWHSKRFMSRDEAYDDQAWRSFIRHPIASWESPLAIPGVSDYAFNYHHSPYGCKSDGSVAECGNKHECVQAGVRQVAQVHSRRRAVAEMLSARS
jgi:hypothetical protein